jgi:hypothetical protein
MKIITIFLYVLLIVLSASGCGPDLSTAQGVTEAFVDQHYVSFDLQKAKDYTVSIALDKVNEEIRLTKRASFLYEGTIQSNDGTSFTRKWLIAARRDGDQWRVSNFTESD